MNNLHTVLLIGHKGFVGKLLKQEVQTGFKFVLISSSDFNDPLKTTKVRKKIIDADLIVLLSFINDNKLEHLMYKNKLLIKNVYQYINQFNKKLFFLSSDSADHGLTPYGRSKIECEQILSNLNNFWFIRPGPIYHEDKNLFKGMLNLIIQKKKIILPLPKRGDFNVKFLSIENLLSIIDNILLEKFKVGMIELNSIPLAVFLTRKNKELILLNMPKLIFSFLKYMPKVIRNRLPLDLIYNAYNN